MKTFVEDKLCPGQTRHNVNNLQIVKLSPIFQTYLPRLCRVLVLRLPQYATGPGESVTGESEAGLR